MADDPNTDTSHKLVDRFLDRERRDIEGLRRVLGSDAVAKLDRVTTRDLISEDRDRNLSELLGDEKPPAPRRFRVIVNMKSGRGAGARAAPSGTKRDRKQTLSLMQRSGQQALARAKGTAEQNGARILRELWLPHSLVVEVNRKQLLDFVHREDVGSVNHDKKVIALALDTSRPLIGAATPPFGVSGIGINVAILDTGVDFAHPALAPGMGTQQDFSGDGVGDVVGHGTHCAGIVGSRDATFRGVAPGCTINDYKLMDNTGSADAGEATTAIQIALRDDMQVLSNSWGFSHGGGNWTCPDGNCVLCTAANNASKLAVFVVAAGNEDNETSWGSYDTHIRCPGHATDVITVAASDDNDAMAGFSSIGPCADGRPKPDITAPGVDIMSTQASTTGFVEMSGTSMACPHVAGVCALMLQHNISAGPDTTTIKSVIMQTALDIGAISDEMGAGRIDAAAAVNAI